MQNWTNFSGPQWFSYSSANNASYDYMKLDPNIKYNQRLPNAYNWNCVPGACPDTAASDNYMWSETYTTTDNLPYGSQNVSIFAHELGHVLGLDVHTSAGSAIMNDGSTLQGPTFVDIGRLPPCSGDSTNMGTRCIYNWTS
jgi:hypothetical protein